MCSLTSIGFAIISLGFIPFELPVEDVKEAGNFLLYCTAPQVYSGRGVLTHKKSCCLVIRVTRQLPALHCMQSSKLQLLDTASEMNAGLWCVYMLSLWCVLVLAEKIVLTATPTIIKIRSTSSKSKRH
jgi:hypothetical protein